VSDEIAEILAICLERMEVGASLESCLADYPHQAAELEPLLRMTQQMSSLSKVGPRPLFAQNARQNLEKQLITPQQPVTVHRQSRHTRPEPKLLPQSRLNLSWLKLAIAAMLALTATTGGVAYAAHSSNPGDVLHGLDIAMENVQLNLAPDVASKVQLRLEFASERLSEAQETFAENDVADGLEAMNEYGSEISAAAQLIGSADGADQDALLALLEAAQGVHQDVLTQLLDTVPDQAKDGIQNALDASSAPAGSPVPGGTGAPDGAGIPDEIGAPADAPGVDIRACASALSRETAQALVNLAKKHGADHQYVLQNFCALGTLERVEEMLSELDTAPTHVPPGPPSDVPGGPPDGVPGGPPDNVPGGKSDNAPVKP